MSRSVASPGLYKGHKGRKRHKRRLSGVAYVPYVSYVPVTAWINPEVLPHQTEILFFL